MALNLWPGGVGFCTAPSSALYEVLRTHPTFCWPRGSFGGCSGFSRPRQRGIGGLLLSKGAGGMPIGGVLLWGEHKSAPSGGATCEKLHTRSKTYGSGRKE